MVELRIVQRDRITNARAGPARPHDGDFRHPAGRDCRAGAVAGVCVPPARKRFSCGRGTQGVGHNDLFATMSLACNACGHDVFSVNDF